MRISPWFEMGTSVVGDTQVGVALTLPFLVDAFVDDFDVTTFYSWMRYDCFSFIPQLFLVVLSTVGTLACLKVNFQLFRIGLILDFISSGFCSFLLIFSSQSPTYKMCESSLHSAWSTACLEHDTSICAGINVSTTSSFTWILGISIMLGACVGNRQGLWFRTMIEGYSSLKPKETQEETDGN